MAQEQKQQEITADGELDACFSPVDILQDGGISAVDIQKLKDAGFTTVEGAIHLPLNCLGTNCIHSYVVMFVIASCLSFSCGVRSPEKFRSDQRIQ